MKRIILVTGIFLLFTAEILRVYFIMPFPGSQQSNTIGVAYWLGRNMVWIRILLFLLIAVPVAQLFLKDRVWKKILLSVFLALYAIIFYFVNFRFEADKMFYQPRHKNFSLANRNGADTVLVIGVAINGVAKAYPIQIIGYHHQVTDTIGNTAVIVTYCTVCRTGRVFSPVVNGKPEKFRLVGMDHYNAMFEDSRTGSWWQQATGVAIAGPLKGHSLAEIPSQQVSLAAWLRLYPEAAVLAPDSSFAKQYKGLENYNNGTIKGRLEKRDSASWQLKSWVVGVLYKQSARAYDWNDLLTKELIEDSIAGIPLMLTVENDAASFHAWSRNQNGRQLHFEKNRSADTMSDHNTNSTWNMNGECIAGILKGNKLERLPAYQEFWHSWKYFHPETSVYK